MHLQVLPDKIKPFYEQKLQIINNHAFTVSLVYNKKVSKL